MAYAPSSTVQLDAASGVPSRVGRTRSTTHRDLALPRYKARSREIEEGAQRLPRLVALGGERDQIERGVEVHL